jgi:hypothetical protein
MYNNHTKIRIEALYFKTLIVILGNQIGAKSNVNNGFRIYYYANMSPLKIVDGMKIHTYYWYLIHRR